MILNGKSYEVEYLEKDVFAFSPLKDAFCMSPTTEWMWIVKNS